MNDDRIKTGRTEPPTKDEWAGLWALLDKTQNMVTELQPVMEFTRFARKKWVIGVLFLFAAVTQRDNVLATAAWVSNALGGP